jgi:hypothetical protein
LPLRCRRVALSLARVLNPYAMDPTPAPFVVPDLRNPGEAMASLPLKLPADALAQLQAQSDRLRCNRGALARTLIVRGLAQLEQAAAAQGEA